MLKVSIQSTLRSYCITLREQRLVPAREETPEYRMVILNEELMVKGKIPALIGK
jgi:hypothetical protein